MSKEERIGKIYQELETEISQGLKGTVEKENQINYKLRSLQDKMMRTIEDNCKESYSWIQENTRQEQNENGMKFIIKDENQREQAHKVFKEFEECSSRFDFGLRRKLEESREDVQKISNSFLGCSDNCIGNLESKQDNEIKVCLRQCFDVSLQKSELIQEDIIKKIDDILYKF